MKLKGLVEMFVARDHDEPDYDGPRDFRGLRLILWGSLVFWVLFGIGVYSCVS
jgi:hypothetical protein